jgi:hypothetical protein
LDSPSLSIKAFQHAKGYNDIQLFCCQCTWNSVAVVRFHIHEEAAFIATMSDVGRKQTFVVG